MSKELLKAAMDIRNYIDGQGEFDKDVEVMDWLIEQAEQVEKLENRNKELEYASKYNGDLNEFLQKRKLPPKTLGRHVVDVVMDYVEESEEEIGMYHTENIDLSHELLDEKQQNKRYRELLTSEILKDIIRLEDKGQFLPSDKREQFTDFKWALKALESESE